MYALMSYGIPIDAIPISMDGDLKKKNHSEWIKMRKRQEKSGEARIVVPTHSDVLFGRGKPYREHIGNMRLFNLLDDNLDRYAQASLKGKSAVIAEMVVLIQQRGGRFLKQEKGVWVKNTDKLAKEKVSHAFRTRIRILSADRLAKDRAIQNTKTILAPEVLSSARIETEHFDTTEKKRARLQET